MNKKIILSIAASLLLATSVYASCKSGEMNKGCKAKSSECMMKKNKSSKKHGSIVNMVMMLDLKDEQRVAIRDIMRTSRKDMPKPSAAFSNTSFDKQKFIDISKQKREAMIKNKADTIQKIYALLDESQKKDFKTMIDNMGNKNNKMMKKGSCSDKNCNGRG